MEKTKRVEVRFEPIEYVRLRNIADETGHTVSEVVRSSSTRTEILTLENKELSQTKVRQIAKIGNNLNQIARWANTHKNKADTVRIIAHLIAIRRALERLAYAD